MWHVCASQQDGEVLKLVCQVRITAICDNCNYKVQGGSLHGIYYHLDVGSYHSVSDWRKHECVGVCEVWFTV